MVNRASLSHLGTFPTPGTTFPTNPLPPLPTGPGRYPAPATGPVCPACGGLECLCRPRFFAGQLLTDEVLNQLDRYIREKNKLHNRYLVGTGVVCGLEVVCNVCDGYVTVQPGYAISPCGDDIVVCGPDDVNICDLINACKERDRYQVNCDPPRPQRADDCADLEEEWVLMLCYEERPSRGVMALRAGSGCSRCGGRGCSSCGGGGSTGCSCGGSSKSGRGCSCGGSSAASTSTRRAWSNTQPAQCEPSLTCETYHFELRKAPPKRAIREPLPNLDGGWVPSSSISSSISGLTGIGSYLSGLGAGPFWDRFLNCFYEIAAAIPQRPANQTVQSMYAWCCAVKAAIQDLLVTHGSHDCNLDDALAHMVCPPPTEMPQDQYFQLIEAHVTVMLGIAARLLKACMCSILLPPCPDPADDNCVSVATITVRRSDCHIVRVCNFENRDMVITMQTLRYWLSAFPFEERLMQALAALCCEDELKMDKVVGSYEIPNASEYGYLHRMYASTARSAEHGTEADPFVNLFAGMAGGRDEPLDVYSLLLDAVGARGPGGRPLVSEAERAFPLQATLLNRVFMPALGGLAGMPAAARTDTAGLAEMRESLNSLREQVTRQADEIDRLRRQG